MNLEAQIYRVLVFAVLLTAFNWQATAQNLTYNGSAQYATGDYFFTERTGSFFVSNGLSVSGGSITLSINVPYIVQSSPWISYSAHGLLATGGPGSGTVSGRGSEGMGMGTGKGRKVDPGDADTVSYTRASFGDPNISGTFRIFTSQDRRTSLQASASVKFPLADPSNGFGTGAWDFGSGLSFAQRLGSHYIWLVNAMYWQLGDMDDLEFKNPVSFSSGLGRVFAGSKWMVSANIYGYTKILDEADPPLSTGLSSSVGITDKVQLSANLVIGLSESVSDLSMGLGWSVRL